MLVLYQDVHLKDLYLNTNNRMINIAIGIVIGLPIGALAMIGVFAIVDQMDDDHEDCPCCDDFR